MARDPYEVLGVSKAASQDQIRQAFRALARQYHPDLNPGNKEAERLFKEVNAAYEQIGDEEKRSKFDQEQRAREQWERARTGPAGGGGGGFQFGGGQFGGGQFGGFGEDFFDSLFRGREGMGAGHASEGFAVAGEDQIYEMEIGFQEAALGGEREITLPNSRKLRVKIPPGVDTGARLRFQGQGGPGFGGGPPGDVYVQIRVRPSKVFQRRGDDLEVSAKVPLETAVLGGEITVPTLEGTASLKIPPGVSSGARLRMRSKGVINRKTRKRGDQFVVIQIALPEQRDPELEHAIRTWRQGAEGAGRRGGGGGRAA